MANVQAPVNAALRPFAAVAVPASVSAGQNVSLAGTGKRCCLRTHDTTYAWFERREFH